MKKDVSIQAVRIFAMFSIILCHLVQEFNNNKIAMLAQFFNVGVFIFLFLSGYLYGNKDLNNKLEWYKKRFIKIMIPVYIFLIFFFALQLILNTFELKYLFIYVFNLQYFLGGVIGIGHLWFLSVISIAYLITPILFFLKNKGNLTIFNITLLFIGILACYINEKFGQAILYILAYTIGYEYKNKNININNFILFMGLVFSIVVRLVCKYFLDGSILYDKIIVSMTQLTIAFEIFYILRDLIKKMKIENNKFINYLDAITFPIYIVHYMFMVGPIRLMGITNNLFLNTFLTLLASCFSAILLNFISNNIKENIFREV